MPPSCALLGGFAIGARNALLWQHYGNAWQSTEVIRQAQRTPHAPAIKSTRLLRVRRYLQRGRSISSILCGCCNANAKCYRVHACTRSMPSFSIVFKIYQTYFGIQCWNANLPTSIHVYNFLPPHSWKWWAINHCFKANEHSGIFPVHIYI